MFCPLCKAEYQPGFSTCSDCQIPLVGTQGEAAAIEVDRLWTGDDRKKFESTLDALIDAGIPSRPRESLKSEPWPWLSILLFRFVRPRSTFEYGIDVLHRDRDRAEAAIPKSMDDDDIDDEGLFCPLCQSEFRAGFTECSNCHVALVPARAEASAASVRLWKGDRQKELDRILAALDEVQIPCHFKELLNATPHLTFLGIPIRPQRSNFEYEVWVFRSDLERARSAARVV